MGKRKPKAKDVIPLDVLMEVRSFQFRGNSPFDGVEQRKVSGGDFKHSPTTIVPARMTPEEIAEEDAIEIMAMTGQVMVPLPSRRREPYDAENPDYREGDKDFFKLGLHFTQNPNRRYGFNQELDS